jgi:DNA-binding response OmpR family regulator
MATHSDRKLDVLCKRLTETVMGAALCANEIIAMVREMHGDGDIAAANSNGRWDRDGHSAQRPLLDESTLSVFWNGGVLALGHTQAFWLLARLTRSTNQYVTHVDLIQEVWDDDFTKAATLRAGVRRLRRKLRDGGMGDLANAIVGHHGRYILNLNTPPRHTEVTVLSR